MPVLHLRRRLKAALAAVALTVVVPARAADRDPRVAPLLRWIQANSDRSGLPHSHVGDDRLTNWTFTYDAASTALAYLAAGDRKRAAKIIDFYLRTAKAFRLGGVIEAVNPTSAALGEDYGVRAGANIWLGIASYHLFRATGDTRFLRFAKLQADFALSLQITDARDPNFGAVRMGPVGAGQTPGDQHLEFDERLPALFDLISTENNLDAFALFGMIAHEAPSRIKTYAQGRDRVLDWLKRVGYDRTGGRFNRGAYRAVDAKMASDVQSWAVSALGPDRLDSFAPDATALVLDAVEKSCVVDVPFRRPDGTEATVRGVDFVDAAGAKEAGRERMVSPEWTFQLANAYARAGKPEKRAALIEGIFNAAVRAEPADGGLAFPYATLADAPVGHGWNTPAEGTLSVVGAAWAVMTLNGFDPLIGPN